MKRLYKRTEWVNDVTPVNAKNMNHIECGIEDLYTNAIEYNQILVKNGLSIESDPNKNIILGQNIIFTSRIPESIDQNVIYYIIDSEERLRGIIINGRFMNTSYKTDEEDNQYETTFTSDVPDIIEYTGVDVEVSLVWDILRDGISVIPDTLEILKDDESLPVISTDMKTITTTINKIGDTTFKLIAHFLEDGTVINKTLTITQTYYSYIGFSRNTDTVEEMSNSLRKVLITDSLNIDGLYKNDNFSDNYFTVCVPDSLALGMIKVGGIEVPVDDPIIDTSTGIRYKVYRSSNRINPLSELNITGTIARDEEQPEPIYQDDYYIGWANMSSTDFYNLPNDSLLNYAIRYNTEESPIYTNTFGENSLFFIAYTEEKQPTRIIFTSNGQEMVQSLSNDNTAEHNSITIDGKVYNIWGINHPGFAEYDPEDRITIIFS